MARSCVALKLWGRAALAYGSQMLYEWRKIDIVAEMEQCENVKASLIG